MEAIFTHTRDTENYHVYEAPARNGEIQVVYVHKNPRRLRPVKQMQLIVTTRKDCEFTQYRTFPIDSIKNKLDKLHSDTEKTEFESDLITAMQMLNEKINFLTRNRQ